MKPKSNAATALEDALEEELKELDTELEAEELELLSATLIEDDELLTLETELEALDTELEELDEEDSELILELTDDKPQKSVTVSTHLSSGVPAPTSCTATVSNKTVPEPGEIHQYNQTLYPYPITAVNLWTDFCHVLFVTSTSVKCSVSPYLYTDALTCCPVCEPSLKWQEISYCFPATRMIGSE